MSDLAEHSKHIAADPRVSLLFEKSAGADAPLETPRLSIVGRAEPVDDSVARARYLRRHPDAAIYADFGDFRFYRITADRAHLVAGFGRISWIGADALLPPAHVDTLTALSADEADIIDHMNADHADTLDVYASKLLRLENDGWIMTGIDPEGLDLRHGGVTARLDFDQPVASAHEARTTLVDLARRARGA
jgi:putative heme iron utilization protein